MAFNFKFLPVAGLAAEEEEEGCEDVVVVVVGSGS